MGGIALTSPGARPSSRTCLAWALVLGLLAPACQSAMSIEEAKKVTATFSGASFIPPPRTISDIVALLDEQKRADPEAVVSARARVDQPPPATSDPHALADFYFQRGLAARELGRFRQELDDLSRAAGHERSVDILSELSSAHLVGGSLSRVREIRQEMLDFPGVTATPKIQALASLARINALEGNLEAADARVREAQNLLTEPHSRSDTVANREASLATARATVLQARGRYGEAEAFYRDAVATLAADRTWSKHPWPELQRLMLVPVLIRQERLLEAESEARAAVLGLLSKRGRNSKETALALRVLARTLVEQGRYAEGEALARTSLDMYARIGAPGDSLQRALARTDLAAALAGRGQWTLAAAEYDAIERAMAGDARLFANVLAWVATRHDQAIALLKSGQPDRAVEILAPLLERQRATLGDTHRATAETRGLLAAAHASRGERGRALAGFSEAARVLLDRSSEVDDEATTRPAREQRLRLILGSYMSLLAHMRGTGHMRGTEDERRAGIDAIAEAFRLAEIARGAAVQRSLDAVGSRGAAKTAALADLVRREQDARKQIGALYGLVARAQAYADGQAPKIADTLRGQIDTLRRAHRAIRRQIESEFPAYTQLINPQPMTLDQARSHLRPGEALISTYVDDERSFLWAVPSSGPVAFAVVPIGAQEVEKAVATLRKALEPRAETLGDIPDFDLALAHRLYSTLLEPVRAGWQDARSLLVVAHGPLGQLPLALLPTAPSATARPAESAALFSGYREVPWLVRSHALTMLPSVSSLSTLRSMPAGDPGRAAFVGFGDPYFSQEQAAQAETGESAPRDRVALATRAMPIQLRSSPPALDSMQLARLPRLPETAAEIRDLAASMDADPSRDVFLGARANEKAVKTLDLSTYRVIAFATHGLVPGDLDGLTQPALALSAPGVAGVEGDGLLTMDEIMGLRLNADWVVLSACNTASGQGAGAEAVSGLGRAFFYAGARALLVSNWPVETTSARALTTELFRRQQQRPGLSRTEALQETLNWLIDRGGLVDAGTGQMVFSYAHPIFWAPFTLIGDGGR